MDCFSHYGHPNSSEYSSNTNGKDQKNKGNSGKKNRVVKLSTDPQSVAARERRHRISDRFKILQSLVPGGTKMDTVSMLEEAIHYVKFLKSQILLHQTMINDFKDVDPSLVFVPRGTASDLVPAAPPCVYSPENFVGCEGQSSGLVGWPDYQLECEETMPFYGTTNY